MRSSKTSREYKMWKKDINELRNKHKDKRCFIIASGPSINEKDLLKVNSEVLIGANNGGLVEKKWGIDLNYLVTGDGFRLYTSLEMYKDTKADIVIGGATERFGKFWARWSLLKDEDKQYFYDNAYYVKFLGNKKGRITEKNISFDLSIGQTGAGTVVQDFGIPLAVWLGCNPIYLMGCDCDSSGYFHTNKEVKNQFIGNSVTRQYVHYKNKLNKLGIDIYNINDKVYSCPEIPKIKLDDIL
jgi:hypothetical protein